MNKDIAGIIERYCDVWELLPDQSNYTLGVPPQQGKYIISMNNGKVYFDVSWIDAEGNEMAIKFDGIPDNERYDVSDFPGVSATLFGVDEDDNFISVAYNNDIVLNSAIRRLSEDNQHLFVDQKILGADNRLYKNSATYIRVSK